MMVMMIVVSAALIVAMVGAFRETRKVRAEARQISFVKLMDHLQDKAIRTGSAAVQVWTPEELEAFGINDNERFIRETDKILSDLDWLSRKAGQPDKREEWNRMVDQLATPTQIRRNGHADPVEEDVRALAAVTQTPTWIIDRREA
jgi:hypothetical protein